MAPIQPYAHQHATLNGPGDQRPTAEQVIRDQDLIGALKGTNVLITGCTSGLGRETARVLYLAGANIWITVRDQTKGDAVAAELSTDPSRPVKAIELALDSFDSIRKAAATFLAQTDKLNILVNNAGVMASPHSTTAQGHELQWGTNHLGHFLLFQLMKPALLEAATLEQPSRVVAVSSTGHRLIDKLDLDNLDFSKSAYEPYIAYANSKLSNIYFANELDRRYGAQHLHALSLHPGSIRTELQRHMVGAMREYLEKVYANPDYQRQAKSVEQGAATQVWAAVGKEWKECGGLYLENVGEAVLQDEEGPLWRTGYSEAAFRPEDERKLWELSERLCGV